MILCARCKREVKAEDAVYSPSRKRHYCGPREWKSCDALWAAELEASKKKDAA